MQQGQHIARGSCHADRDDACKVVVTRSGRGQSKSSPLLSLHGSIEFLLFSGARMGGRAGADGDGDLVTMHRLMWWEKSAASTLRGGKRRGEKIQVVCRGRGPSPAQSPRSSQ